MENNIVHPEQHGFVRGKSTCTNLLESLNDWTRNIQMVFLLLLFIYIYICKKTYQFKIHCKDDVMISLH